MTTPPQTDTIVRFLRDSATTAVDSVEQVVELAVALRGEPVSVANAAVLLGIPHATAQRLLAGNTPNHQTLRRLAENT